MKRIIGFTLAGFALFQILTSCDTKSCSEVVCLGNNQTCVNGQCVCQPGYEGANCDIPSYEKFVGFYRVSESCTTTLSGTVNQTFFANIYSGYSINQVSIGNFANRGCEVQAYIDNEIYLYIQDQNVCALQVSGGQGNYQSYNNRIEMEYNFTSGSNFHQCTAIYTPQ